MYKLVAESNRPACPRSGNLEAKIEIYSLDSAPGFGRPAPVVRRCQGRKIKTAGSARQWVAGRQSCRDSVDQTLSMRFLQDV